jgi:hypothetical protein
MAIGRWFWHIITAMVRGCLVLAVTAAIVSVLAALVATHKLPQGFALFLIVAIVIISGLLGAVGALAWRLSHIGELVHVAETVVEQSGHHHQSSSAHP